MNKITPTKSDWGWFAGLVDGDGCISIGKNGGKYYSVSIIVVNKKPQNILKLMRLFGGSLDKISRTTTSSYVNGRYYRWVILGADDVLRCLENALPHLAEKHDKAKIALELCRVQIEYRALHTYKNRDGANAKMELLYQSALIETDHFNESVAEEIRKERPARTHHGSGD